MPWWQLGGTPGIPVETGNGLAGSAILAVAGWIALGWRVIELTIIGAFQFREPAQVVTNGPGIWLAGLGLAVLSRAVYEMAAEPAHR